MSVIINPRGTSGAGKTELVRRIMALYGWQRHDGWQGHDGWPRQGTAVPVYRPGRERPICYRLQHPGGGRPLAVLGHYEATCGGCDTLRGLDHAFGLAREYASDGHDVIFEGLVVSRDHERSARLAEAHRLHVLRLSTPVEACARQVIARRRARRDSRPFIFENTAAEDQSIEDACARLPAYASVETVSFDDALVRAQELLGLRELRAP